MRRHGPVAVVAVVVVVVVAVVVVLVVPKNNNTSVRVAIVDTRLYILVLEVTSWKMAWCIN